MLYQHQVRVRTAVPSRNSAIEEVASLLSKDRYEGGLTGPETFALFAFRCFAFPC